MKRSFPIVPGSHPNEWPISHLGKCGFRGCQLLNDQTILNATSIKINCPTGGSIQILWGDGTVTTVFCNGVTNNYIHNYIVQGQYVIQVVGSTELITYFGCYGQAWIGGSLNQITRGFSAVLDSLILYNVTLTGNLSAVSDFTSLRYLYLSNNVGIMGVLSSISGLVNLKDCMLYNTGVTGVLSSISGLVNLSNLHLYSTGIVGNISALSGITGFLRSDLYGLSIDGDLSVISALPNLIRLRIENTNVSDYTSTPLPAFAGTNLQVFSIGLDSTEVDNFLIDLADGIGANGTLDIAGTNAARTSDSNAAKAIILAAGWNLTVNE